MEEKIAVLGGKGGVGKSLVASSLSVLLSREKKIIALDCDVDTPNLAIWLGEKRRGKIAKKVFLSKKPVFRKKKCKNCSYCLKKCPFSALYIDKKGAMKVNKFLCEGCGLCQLFCPPGSLYLRSVLGGEVRVQKTKHGFPLFSGHLLPGEEASGKMVEAIKEEARKRGDSLQVIDSPPGRGCPVKAILKDSSFALLVSEPTLAAFADLKRTLDLVFYFQLPWALVINKWQINESIGKRMEKWAGKNFLGKISYDLKIFDYIDNLVPPIEKDSLFQKEFTFIYKRLLGKLAL